MAHTVKSYSLFIWIFVLLLLSLFGFLFIVSERDDHTHNENPLFMYETFVQAYPVFAQEEAYYAQKKYQELGHLFESAIPTITNPIERAYAQYITIRAYVYAVRQNNNDSDSLEKALRIAQTLLTERKHLPISAYTVDTLDMLLYPRVMQASGLKTVMNDMYFKKFGTTNSDGTIARFRENLLLHGDVLHPVSNIQLKIALIHTQRLKNNEDPLLKEKLKKQILTEMANAQITLNQDMLGRGPFGHPSYLPEPLYNKALVADTYYRATGETPFGEVKALYQTALDEADRSFPPIKPIITRSLRDHESYRQYF